MTDPPMIRGRAPFPPGWWAVAFTAPRASLLPCEEGVVGVVAASLPPGSVAVVPAVDLGTLVAVEGWAPATGMEADPPTAAAGRPEVGDAGEPGEATTAGCWVAATVVGVTGAAVVGVEVRASGQMAA